MIDALGLGTILKGSQSNPTYQQCTVSSPCSTGCSIDPSTVGATSCPTAFHDTQTDGTVTHYDGDWTTIWIGLLLLNKPNTAPTLEFTALDAQTAQQMFMTENERVAFNHSLPEINLIAQDFVSQVTYRASQGAKADDLKAFAHQLWETQAKPVLSADAYLGAQKAGTVYSGLLQ